MLKRTGLLSLVFLAMACGGSALTVDAGEDQEVLLGGTVELEATLIDDVEGPVAFTWTLVTRPTGSQEAFTATGAQVRFTPTTPGTYALSVTASSAKAESVDTVRITAKPNAAPVADAGGDQSVSVGELVALDGSASQDPEGHALTFSWTLNAVPDGSAAALSDASDVTADFTPDLPGTYLVSLTVSDGVQADSAALTVQVFPADITVHVAPDGDDTASGTEGSPLASVAAALSLVEREVEAFKRPARILLGAGSYTEAFDHGIHDLLLEIIGPEDGTAKLVAPAVLFKVTGTSRVTLRDLAVESPDTALLLDGREAVLTLDAVTCAALLCAKSGRESGEGGVLEVRNSRFVAGPILGDMGVSSFQGEVHISDTEITGFSRGIQLDDSQLVARALTIEGAATGILIIGTSNASVLIEDSTFVGGSYGVQALNAANVRITGCTFSIQVLGVNFGGGTLQLEDVAMSWLDVGVHVSGSNGEHPSVSVRGARFESISGPAFRIGAGTPHLDLGTASEPGNNQLASITGVAIEDTRPVDATGLVTLSDTTLNGGSLTSGTYTGALTTGPFRISGAGNRITVY